MIEICFVCTGNTCRSIMAERIAKKMAKSQKVVDVKFSSAGTHATGAQITQNAALTLKNLGYDSRSRKSVKIKKPKDNVIYVAMTNEHKKFLGAKKCISMIELGQEVPDPYGKSLAEYEKTAKILEENIKVLLQKIQDLRGEA